MWTLEKTITFEASHVLPHHNGKCARLHGHSWKATVALSGIALQVDGPQRGMVVDFAYLKVLLAVLHDTHLDHHHLNDSTGLENPTSEALAKWMFDKLTDMIGDELRPLGVWLSHVRVEETCTSACTYVPDPIMVAREA